MRCWSCDADLIWGGDHDVDDDESDHLIETNLSCPGCKALVIVYHGERQSTQES